MKATRVIQSLCLLLVAASVALGQNVNVDWNRSANFQRYTIYAWGECVDPGELSQLWHERIVQNIEAQLAARGFRKAAPGQQPDVIVNYRSDVKERVSSIAYDYGYGPGWGLGPGLSWGPSWGWGWGGGPVTAEPIMQQELALTVDLVDARQNRLIWRGDASEPLSRKSEKNIKRLRKAVEKLFRNYPYGA